MATVDHRAAVAIRKIGAIPGFEWYEWRSMRDPDGTVMLTGAVVTGTVASGKRKGRKNYGEPIVALVTDAEMLAERRRFEHDTGNCAECGGDGQAFAGWDHKTGTKWRTCPKCGGSGKPVSADAVDPHAGVTLV